MEASSSDPSKRTIFVNSPQKHKFCNNRISTAKYSLLSFVPRFLFEQFRKYANVFFLVVTLLQQIPDVSPMGKLNTLLPFSVMMLISLTKEVFQDVKRHRADRSTNNRMVQVNRNKQWTDIMWQHVAVGDIVRIEDGGPFPSDLILLSSSEPNGLCYIDTCNLDGETNLKLRQALKETAQMITPESVMNMKAMVECELPNRHLYDFSGTIRITDSDNPEISRKESAKSLLSNISIVANSHRRKTIIDFKKKTPNAVPIGPEQILLRGSQLKNTNWIYGISIYTGKDSKLVLNSTTPPLKQTHVERQTNYQIIYLFLILIVLSLTCACFNELWVDSEGCKHWYLSLDAKGSHRLFFNFLTFIILFNNLIPISLQVTLEVVKFQQAIFINWDKDMYYPRTDTPANARTSNLNEELGQIKYLFSDKTGTLTQNIMTFRKCSIAGTIYEDKVDEEHFSGAGVVSALRALEKEIQELRIKEQSIGAVSKNALKRLKSVGRLSRQILTSNKHLPLMTPFDHVSRSQFPDYNTVYSKMYQNNFSVLERKEYQLGVMAEYLILLGVCHTVIPQIDPETGDIAYMASSPDEAALVAAAQTMQHVFTARTPTECMVNERGVDKTYEMLNVLEFTSKRKRMSVIVKTPEGKIKLYCKGADNVIYDRLGNFQFTEATLHHLERFAAVGLRTLCLSYADISPEFYKEWSNTFYLASTALEGRELKLELAAELIETNLTLLGATAIEDKLQDGVPETIHTLAQADIKIWVLTGDKQETAINIGYSCKLLTKQMELVVVNEDTLEATKESLIKHKKSFGDMLGKDNLVALIIDGQSLRYAYAPECQGDFLEIAMSCKAVICCRVSPLQKAELVELVKNSQKAITLAIGDGANDVGMIQAAHVGVGISGEEGLQAACASDYSIGQFRFLQKLLLVHGAWSYSRVAKLVLYCFYKNIVLYLTQFWFQVFNGFSGQILYEKWTISMYNLCFTSVPPLVIGLFDRYCSAQTMLDNPLLYKDSQTGKLFNGKVFWLWIFNSVFHSGLIWAMTYLIVRHCVVWPDGRDIDSFFMGNYAYTYTVVTVCLKAALEITAWTWLTHVAIWGSILSWFAFIPLYSLFFQHTGVAPEFVGMAERVFSTYTFWLGLLLVPTACLMKDVAWKVISRDVFESHLHAVQDMERDNQAVHVFDAIKDMLHTSGRDKRNRKKHKLNRKNSTSLHGYAFAQEQGGAVSQSDLIRSYDTRKRKPTGL